MCVSWEFSSQTNVNIWPSSTLVKLILLIIHYPNRKKQERDHQWNINVVSLDNGQSGYVCSFFEVTFGSKTNINWHFWLTGSSPTAIDLPFQNYLYLNLLFHCQVYTNQICVWKNGVYLLHYKWVYKSVYTYN